MNPRRAWGALGGVTLMTLLAVGGLPTLSAHEVPNDVLIQAFVKSDGPQLRMLVRIPLIALRDMTWPFKSPGILDIDRATSELHNAATLWLGDESTMYEGDRRLPSPKVAAIRATLPIDRSFESYDQALALITGPGPADTDDIAIRDGFLDVLFEYPIESETSRFSLEPRWGRLGVHAQTTVHLILPNGAVRTFELQGNPGLVRLDPSWDQTARRFIADGFMHILRGNDYLLLLCCVVMPFRRIGDLIAIIAAFSVAHAVTLIASAYGMAPEALWFPSVVATLVAASIVYAAIENIAGTTVRRRRLIACVCGLVCGFSFSFALGRTLQFAGAHSLVSILSFTVGIEAGQVTALALAVPILGLLFRLVVPERIGIVLLSALALHTGWHWMTGRAAVAARYQFTRPELTPVFLLDVIRWLIVLVAVAGAAWFIGTIRKSQVPSPRSQVPGPKSQVTGEKSHASQT